MPHELTSTNFSLRLSGDRLKAFVHHCDTKGLTPSQVLRQAVDLLLGSGHVESSERTAAEMRRAMVDLGDLVVDVWRLEAQRHAYNPTLMVGSVRKLREQGISTVLRPPKGGG